MSQVATQVDALGLLKLSAFRTCVHFYGDIFLDVILRHSPCGFRAEFLCRKEPDMGILLLITQQSYLSSDCMAHPEETARGVSKGHEPHIRSAQHMTLPVDCFYGSAALFASSLGQTV